MNREPVSAFYASANVQSPIVRLVKTFALLIGATFLCACGSGSSGGETDRPSPAAAQEWFTDEAKATGLDFVHFNGMSGGLYMAEIIGPGVALFDYDNDGDLDVYFTQGRMLGDEPLSAASFPPRGTRPLRGRLFRNDLAVGADGSRTLRFADVTESSGIDATAYGMGAAVGDVNNDGCPDLYLTNFGANQLFRNNCDGTFTDVSRETGTGDAGWAVSAAFVDYDRDGWLDLYVGNYVEWEIKTDKPCTGLTGRRDYCTPKVYVPQPDRLYHNRRNGTFEDVTAKALTGGRWGPALGVVTADFDALALLTVVLAGDGRLLELLRQEALVPLGSRIRTRLVTDAATREELLELLRHALAKAGNASLMTA